MSALSDLLLWKSDIDAPITIHPSMTTRPNPLVVDNLVIATLFQPASVLALHRNDGSVAWRREVGKFAADGIHADGVLYVHTLPAIACCSTSLTTRSAACCSS